jgi:hypothetical protein
MYKLANGWTKERVLAQVKKYNNGTRALRIDNKGNEIGCAYRSGDGNRCAVGCFIPERYDVTAFYFGGSARALIDRYPDLANVMPFDEPLALTDFQNAHDDSAHNSVYKSIEEFLRKCVE